MRRLTRRCLAIVPLLYLCGCGGEPSEQTEDPKQPKPTGSWRAPFKAGQELRYELYERDQGDPVLVGSALIEIIHPAIQLTTSVVGRPPLIQQFSDQNFEKNLDALVFSPPIASELWWAIWVWGYTDHPLELGRTWVEEPYHSVKVIELASFAGLDCLVVVATMPAGGGERVACVNQEVPLPLMSKWENVEGPTRILELTDFGP
jgi:hypothetical protein